MKNSQRLIILLVLLSTLILMMSCRKKEASDKITIEVWDYPRPKETTSVWQQQVFRNFEKKHPNVKVDYTLLSWGRGGQKLDVSVASGTYPDLCGGGMKPSYVLQEVLEPLDAYITPEERADINPEAMKICQFENKTYAFPWYATVYLTILNLDVFKERNVAPPKDGVWTWDEFVEKMKKLTFDRTVTDRLIVTVSDSGFSPEPRKPGERFSLMGDGSLPRTGVKPSLINRNSSPGSRNYTTWNIVIKLPYPMPAGYNHPVMSGISS